MIIGPRHPSQNPTIEGMQDWEEGLLCDASPNLERHPQRAPLSLRLVIFSEAANDRIIYTGFYN